MEQEVIPVAWHLSTLRKLEHQVHGYIFTAMASAEAGRRVLAGEHKPGFQTPALLFGKGFAETIADTTIIDIAVNQRCDSQSLGD